MYFLKITTTRHQQRLLLVENILYTKTLQLTIWSTLLLCGEWLLRSRILMEDVLRIYGHLGLFEAHHVVIRWPPDTSPFYFFRSKRVNRCCLLCMMRGVSGSCRHGIARGDHTHWACLLLPCVIFHHWSSSTSRFLDYIEDIYIMVLSVLVSILDPNHMYLPLLLTVYCNTMYIVALSLQPM